MGEQQWLEFIFLSFVWIISLKQVDSRRLLLQTPPIVANPWLHLPNILPPIPKFNSSHPPISLPQPSPHSPTLLQLQPPRPSLMPNMPGSIPPSILPTWATFSMPPLPSFPWTIPSPPTPSFQWTNLTFPWNFPSPPHQNNPTFSWVTPSPPPPTPNTFPWINVTNSLPTMPSLPWNSPSPSPLSNMSFPWDTPSTPQNSPLFPWTIPSPPPQPSSSNDPSPPPPFPNFPWLNPSPPLPFSNFPWLNSSPPPVGISTPLPQFGLPPGNPPFPTGIQFTFSNFTQSWLPEAGVKEIWQSTISIEFSLQLFVEALMKPIILILSSISGNENGPGSWDWRSGSIDSKLGANVEALCTKAGKDGFPVQGIVIAQTPIDDTVSTAVTWFTMLFNGWSKDTPPRAILDRTLGSFGGFVTNTTVANLKTFCSHPASLNGIAAKQGQYVLN